MSTTLPGPRTTNAHLLIKVEQGFSWIGIKESIWREALERAVPDPSVGIRHAQISGNEDYRIHVASIPEQVGCHYHSTGDEVYSVVEGSGILTVGTVIDGEVPPTEWRSLFVTKGDSFVIPENCAHQLRRSGLEDLTILFGCPDAHLSDVHDRHHLPDSPNDLPLAEGASPNRNPLKLPRVTAFNPA